NFLQDPAIEGIIVTLRDITSRIESENRMFHLSTHDQLTDLPNKMFFENTLDSLLNLENDIENELALYLIEIGSFRYVKDNFTYNVVESYIKEVSKIFNNY